MKKLIFLAIFCLGVWLTTLYYSWHAFNHWTAERMAKLGQLGDVFGFLNTLFSGLAFLGAIFAIILQIRQHKEQTDHERELMIRGKLEQLVFELTEVKHRLYDIMYTLGRDHGACKVPELSGPIGSVISRALMLMRLYFPSLVSEYDDRVRMPEITKAFKGFAKAPDQEWAPLAKAYNDAAERLEGYLGDIVKQQSKLIAEGVRIRLPN